ncbi:hypothetical protein AURDEDRAFT_74283, partial [Auricularia subglabra TFB-10046 SS5]
LKTGQGTKNLWESTHECNKKHGVTAVKSDQSTLPVAMSKYMPYKHRVIISLRSAVSRRPFNFVADPLYREEVQLLNPLATIPSPRTVSRDTIALHKEIGKSVKDYFKVRRLEQF